MPEQAEALQALQDAGAQALHADLDHHVAEPDETGRDMGAVRADQGVKGLAENAALPLLRSGPFCKGKALSSGRTDAAGFCIVASDGTTPFAT